MRTTNEQSNSLIVAHFPQRHGDLEEEEGEKGEAGALLLGGFDSQTLSTLHILFVHFCSRDVYLEKEMF